MRNVPPNIEGASPIAGEAIALPAHEDERDAPWDTSSDGATRFPDRTTAPGSAGRHVLALGAAVFLVGGLGEALLFAEVTRIWGALVLLVAMLLGVVAWRHTHDRPLVAPNP